VIDTNAISCDVCGIPKGETNHWLVAVTVPPTEEKPGECCIAFAPIGAEVEPDIADRTELQHICSHACAVTLFSQWLGTL
jgi:hypothetical protein